MEILAGRVRNYYKKINVASIEVTESLKVGDLLHITGTVTDIDQVIYSIEISRRQVKEAINGQLAGIKIDAYVRKNDYVYRVDRK